MLLIAAVGICHPIMSDLLILCSKLLVKSFECVLTLSIYVIAELVLTCIWKIFSCVLCTQQKENDWLWVVITLKLPGLHGKGETITRVSAQGE